ncbi:MAG: galactokinase family protein, partial [Oscillospiraceae bacterium]|nr:galactokinase family protein [Oscillospiraceae bacterium]
MANAAELRKRIPGAAFQEQLRDIYLDDSVLEHESKRYLDAIDRFVDLFGDGDLYLFSAPGRTEICGNHTDHQHGKVIAASLNLDVIAVVKKTEGDTITIQSEGFPEDIVDLSHLEPTLAEEGTSAALIRGVAAYFAAHGWNVGGFEAYTTSQVMKGSGMSSSAAFEVLVGTILSGLYNDGAVSQVDIAIASQQAENQFFGKPSGLMDQMACSVGGMIYIDFALPEKPEIRKIQTDFSQYGHALCIVDTKGSHADLTPDYAAVPSEMKQVAAFFGEDVLRAVDEKDFYENISAL